MYILTRKTDFFYRILKGGVVQESQLKTWGENTEVTANIKITAEDNGGEVTCHQSHPALKKPTLAKASLNVLCKFFLFKLFFLLLHLILFYC